MCNVHFFFGILYELYDHFTTKIISWFMTLLFHAVTPNDKKNSQILYQKYIFSE